MSNKTFHQQISKKFIQLNVSDIILSNKNSTVRTKGKAIYFLENTTR